MKLLEQAANAIPSGQNKNLGNNANLKVTEKPGMDEKFLPEAPDRENNEGNE
ncbi:hypothetical protein DAPPUDRAFT_334784, partial [Daphnia pulex]